MENQGFSDVTYYREGNYQPANPPGYYPNNIGSRVLYRNEVDEGVNSDVVVQMSNGDRMQDERERPPRNETEYRKWLMRNYRSLFMPHEPAGGIPVRQLLSYFAQNGIEGFRKAKIQKFIDKIDKNKDGKVSFKEFYDGMITRRKEDLTKSQLFLDFASRAVAPQVKKYHQKLKEEDEEKYGSDVLDGEEAPESYLEAYTCTPPPLCIPVLILAQIIVFIVYGVELNKKNEPWNKLSWTSGVPYWSPLMFNTYYREEVWRYISYMFIHKGYHHIIFNVCIQLLLGIPLELVHKFWRVFPVFMAGVLGGSLASSVVDSTSLLCGASGGVYALIGAHYAIIFMNWEELQNEWLEITKNPMKFLLSAVMRLCVLTLILCIDFGIVIYQRYTTNEKNSTSFAAHVGGLLCGALLGVPVLKNLDKKPWENYLFWICLISYICVLVFGVF